MAADVIHNRYHRRFRHGRCTLPQTEMFADGPVSPDATTHRMDGSQELDTALLLEETGIVAATRILDPLPDAPTVVQDPGLTVLRPGSRDPRPPATGSRCCAHIHGPDSGVRAHTSEAIRSAKPNAAPSPRGDGTLHQLATGFLVILAVFGSLLVGASLGAVGT